MTLSVSDDREALEQLLLPVLEKLLRQEFDLPPLPHVANQVLAFTTDPDAHTEKLAALIQQDIILTSKIFQIANSAARAPHNKVESLQQAIAWLGLNTIAGTTFTLSVQSGVFNVRGYEREVMEIWMHALATGFYAKAIAGQIGQDQDMAFLCGLLHAIGKPFVVHTVNHYLQDSASPLPWTTMRTLMKESYVEVGGQLGEAWDLPAPVKEAIILHEDNSYHLATCPTKGAPITCLAIHLAGFLYDPTTMEEEVLRPLPVVQALQVSENNMNILLEMQDTIRANVETMLL